MIRILNQVCEPLHSYTWHSVGSSIKSFMSQIINGIVFFKREVYFYTGIYVIFWVYVHVICTALSFVKWIQIFRSIFPYSLCWLNHPLQCIFLKNDKQESIFFSTSLWTKPGHLLAPRWNVKCDFDCSSPQSRSLWCWPSAGRSCPSFPGHPCSVQFSASFIIPTLSSEVIGHILYLAQTFLWLAVCKCYSSDAGSAAVVFFEAQADFTWLKMSWYEGLK